jgi:hypothetical protein
MIGCETSVNLHLPDLLAEVREVFCVLKRYSKVSLNAAWTVLFAVGFAKTISYVVV